MAVTSIKNPSSFKLKLHCGTENEKEIFRTKSFGNVKVDATDDAIYGVATALAELQEHTLTDVYRVDNTTIAE